MRSLLGFASLGAGLALGAYVYMPSALPRLDWARPAAPAPEADIIVPKPVAAVRPAGDAARTFAPNSPLFSPAPSGTVAAAPAATDRVVRPASEPVLTATPSGIKVVEEARGMKPADEDSRRELVRNIQKELKRAGCYGGEVHGAWTAASQRAMSTFTERINATLPVKEPDGILLTLVRGAKPGVCGAACPAGQALDAEDRCVPKGVLAAQEQKTKVAAKSGAEKSGSDKAGAGVKAPEPQKVGQGWTTTTTALRKAEPAAPVVAAAPVLAPAPVVANRPVELPGIMTVGGPKPEGDPARNAAGGSVAAAPSDQAAVPPVPGLLAPAPKKVKREASVTPPRPAVSPRTGHTRSVQDIFTHPLNR
jgi:hypothetical protein